MTKSARIQEGVVEFLADGCPHTVQEIKSFLQPVSYTHLDVYKRQSYIS